MAPAASAASSGVAPAASAGTGRPCRARSALDSASERVATAGSAPLDVGLDGAPGLVEPALALGVLQHGGEVAVPAFGHPAPGHPPDGHRVDHGIAGRQEATDAVGEGRRQGGTVTAPHGDVETLAVLRLHERNGGHGPGEVDVDDHGGEFRAAGAGAPGPFPPGGPPPPTPPPPPPPRPPGEAPPPPLPRGERTKSGEPRP